MEKILQSLVFLFFVSSFNFVAQNLLDTSTWKEGLGSVEGFNINGSSAENRRVFGQGPRNNSVLLWEAIPDASSNADGGWNSSDRTINHIKTYRFTVWLKKTNSNNGTSYFGCRNPNNILRLNGTVNNNPYFWYGDLPKLDRWYLVVGYVHGSGYSSNVNYGGIYDGVTGKKVKSIIDYKFKFGTTSVSHRAYLYYDTNVSDRQYFYDPRIELVDGSEPTIEQLIGSNNDTNLLNTSSWVEGSGSVSGFYQNGTTAENKRIKGKGPQGNKTIIWQAIPDKANNSDGGWNSGYVNINPSKSYRFSVWLKKTNSNDGSTYFGCSSANHIYTLSGTLNNNPYFWAGDLPELDKWYLVVGFVHPYTYNSMLNLGAIFDGQTGELVKNISDFKFNSSATNIAHRAYLYYDTNVKDRQYFSSPRIDELNGREPTINQLIRENQNSKLVFNFGTAGNQNQRYYCASPDYCSPTSLISRKVEEYTSIDDNVEVFEEEDTVMNDDVIVYPNPTNNWINIVIKTESFDDVSTISIYNSQGKLLLVKDNPNEVEFAYDLTDKSSGIYYIRVDFTDGRVVTNKIIKN